jgi:hypothetical protein
MPGTNTEKLGDLDAVVTAIDEFADFCSEDAMKFSLVISSANLA